MDVLFGMSIGQGALLRLLRGGHTMELPVTVGTRPT